MMLYRRAMVGGVLLLPLAAHAQTKIARMPDPPPVSYPVLVAQAPDAAGFVPAGWLLEDSATGDLNGDGRNDLVMVLHMQDPSNVLNNPRLGERQLDTNPRILAVAFAVGDGYRLVVQNHALIPRRTDPVLDDPYVPHSLGPVRSTFRVRLGSWASAGSYDTEMRVLTFRWQRERFELIGFDSTETNRASGEVREKSVNFSTNQAVLSVGSIENDRKRERRVSTTPRSPITLQDMGDGLAFDPGVSA